MSSVSASMSSVSHLASASMSLVIIGVCIYVVGVPFGYWLRLYTFREFLAPAQKSSESIDEWVEWRNYDVKSQPNIRAFGGLFEHLKPNCWYFEIVNLLRQFLITGVVLAFDTCATLRIYTSFCVVFAYLLLLVKLKPYADSWNNATNIICSSCLAVLFATQLAILPGEDELDDPRMQELKALLLGIFVAVVFVGVFVISVVLAVVQTVPVRSIKSGTSAAVDFITTNRKVRTKVEPVLESINVKWGDIVPVLELVTTAGGWKEVSKALRDPQGLVESFSSSKKQHVARMFLVARLRSKLDPSLLAEGLSWLDVRPILEGAGIDDLQKAYNADSNFRDVVRALSEKDKTVANKYRLLQLRSAIEPLIQRRGYIWPDVIHMAALDDDDEFWTGAQDPDNFADGLIAKLEADPELLPSPTVAVEAQFRAALRQQAERMQVRAEELQARKEELQTQNEELQTQKEELQDMLLAPDGLRRRRVSHLLHEGGPGGGRG